jgi:hypothetical protein
MNGRRALRWPIAGAIALVMACTSRYESVEVDRIAGDPEAIVRDEGFVVTEGRVVVFAALPKADPQRRPYDVLDTLELRSADPSVAGVERGLSSDSWLLMGSRVGETLIEVHVDGRLEEFIPVEVVAPGEGQ